MYRIMFLHYDMKVKIFNHSQIPSVRPDAAQRPPVLETDKEPLRIQKPLGD